MELRGQTAGAAGDSKVAGADGGHAATFSCIMAMREAAVLVANLIRGLKFHII